MKFLRAFGFFWYDFLIGDDWKIAVYTVAVLALVCGLAASGSMSGGATAIIGTALWCAFFSAGVIADVRKTARKGS